MKTGNLHIHTAQAGRRRSIVFALLLLLSSGPAFANIGNVSSVVDFNLETTKNISLTVTGTGTNTVFVACGGGSFVGSTTVAANDGSAYTTLKSVGFNGNTAVQAILARENVSAGAKTITITFSRTVYGHCRAFEWAGLGAINLTNDVPISSTGTASATPSTGSTATLSTANMLIVTTAGGGTETNWNTGTTPATTGYTSVYWEPAVAYMPMSIDYKTVSATTAQSAAWGNTTGTGTWGAVLVAIPLVSSCAYNPMTGRLCGAVGNK